MELDDTICYCFHVPKRKIRNFLRINSPRRVSQLAECGGAGTGCGWCVPFLKRYFNEFQQTGDVAGDDVNKQSYAEGRQQHIRDGKGKPPGEKEI